MKSMEKIKNKEKCSNALPVSIKCSWRENDVVYVLYKNSMHRLGHRIFNSKLKINSMSINTGDVEYIIAQKDHKCRSQKCDLSTPFRI